MSGEGLTGDYNLSPQQQAIKTLVQRKTSMNVSMDSTAKLVFCMLKTRYVWQHRIYDNNHEYHTYTNNISNATICQRFS